VFGLGSIGSILVDQAAKVGFRDITGYDFDIVEEDNIGSQNYGINHIGLKKTDAIQKLMKDYYNFDMTIVDGKIEANTEIVPEANTIYFCAFDSLEARKMLWDKLKGFPVVWGEARIGRDNQQYRFVDLTKPDPDWIKEYETSLDPNGPRSELACGEKGCFPSNAELVGKIVRQLVNIAEGKPLTTLYIGCWGKDNAIFRQPKEEVAQ
jgi:molybdopterin/thiamine biosynthesis adenylyltransferase